MISKAYVEKQSTRGEKRRHGDGRAPWRPPRSMTTARVVTPLLRLMPVVPAVYSSGDPLRSPCGGLFNRPADGTANFDICLTCVIRFP